MSPLRRMLLVLFASSLAAALALVVYLVNSMEDSAVDQWVESNAQATDRLACWIDLELRQAGDRLGFISGLPEFQTPPDPSLIQRELNGIPNGVDIERRRALDWLLGERDNSFSVLFVLLPNGDHYLSHPYTVQESLEVYNLAHRPYFQLARETRKPVISDTFVGADGVNAVAIDIPILNDAGEITSHLGGVYHLVQLESLLKDSVGPNSLSSLFLTDGAGKPLGHTPGADLDLKELLGGAELLELQSQLQATGPEGGQTLVSGIVDGVKAGEREAVVLSTLDCGWKLMAVSSLDEVVEAYTREAWRVAGLSGLLMIALSWLGIFYTRRIGLRWEEVDRALTDTNRELEVRVEKRAQELRTEHEAHAKAEAELRAREDLFHAITNQSVEGITVADPDGRYTFVNPAFCEMMGYSEEELLEMTVFDVKAKNQDKTSFSKSKNSKEGVPFEVFLQRKNGEEFHSEVLGKMIQVGSENAVLGTVRDITERLKNEEEKLFLERQLQHAQKLESLGVLAGGIAHDFNNLLMAILGNVDLALVELPPYSPVRKNLSEVEKATHRAAELARQMLAYSGKGLFVIEAIELSALVEETAHLLEVSISKKVDLRYGLTRNLPRFDGDATQVRQVIMNLITNASEAIGDKVGHIELTTGSLTTDSQNGSFEDGVPESTEYVYLEITDTGCGMSEETMERVFDPFFSTKFSGRGLGMSAVQGIVGAHHGEIRVESAVGEGSTFRVLFPAKADDVEEEHGDAIDGADSASEKMAGLVLVADDEPSVCDIAGRMLRSLGFDVLLAKDGREAVEVYSSRPDEIALVLLDLTMPHLDGGQAFLAMKEIREDVRVVLCSGYGEAEATKRIRGEGLAGFLQKPFKLELLREVVLTALGAVPPAS